MNQEAEVQTEATTETAAPVEKTTKSIVPPRYAGKYKAGGNDALAAFINEQCRESTGAGIGAFDYDKFWELCKINGIADNKVDHYANQVAEKRHGSQGRSRMTLRNMLATFARAKGTLKNLSGEEVAVLVEKPAVSGAAAKAQEAAAAPAGEGAEAGAF